MLNIFRTFPVVSLFTSQSFFFSLSSNSMADGNNHSNSNSNSNSNSRKKKKKKSRGRKRITHEQILAMKEVYEWAFPNEKVASSTDEFLIMAGDKQKDRKVVFEFHSHTNCSDGFLSPSALVERAHKRGVKVLALTDHDTMVGVPEAVEVARKLGIRIIPGVEISTIFHQREGSVPEEPVHILAYYSGCGPSRYDKLEKFLSIIRDGRYIRAKSMLLKLSKLKVPLKWEDVVKIAGNGVAPGRLHIARAMVEAGYVENLKQAFNRYLCDGGPAYSTGSEPPAEDAIQLICQTGGVAVLAHPWALKNPVTVVSTLKHAGLHAVEVYRSDGKLSAFSDLCDKYELLKLGGSDYHGRGGHDESDLGSVGLPIFSVLEFLRVARPIWCNSIKDTFRNFTDDPSDANLENIARLWNVKDVKRMSFNSAGDLMDLYLSSWLTNEEKHTDEFEELSLKLSDIVISKKDSLLSAMNHQ